MGAELEADIRMEPLEAWLGQLGIGFRGPLELSRIGHGKSNITLAAKDTDGASWILRRPPRGKLLDSAHDVRREARVLEGVADTGVPAPQVVALCEDESVCDVPLLLMERVGGVTLDRGSRAPAIGSDARPHVGPSMVETLATIHAVDLDRAGLADLGRRDNYGARQLRRWSRQWVGSGGRDLPAVGEVATRLQQHVPPDQESRLVHGDFHPLNCIFDPDRGQVEAVLDWELATIGDPLADLGTLLAYWSPAGEHPLGEPFAVTGLPGFASRAKLREGYGSLTDADLGDLPFWEALANWKIAIIAEGVNQRHREDPINPPGLPDPAIDLLLKRAVQILDQGDHDEQKAPA